MSSCISQSKCFKIQKGSVIPKVEPRLQGFKLKEILFSNVQINENKLRIKLIYNQNYGKSYTTINVTCWYNIKAVGKIKQSLKK